MLWDQGLIKGHGDFTHVGVFDPSKSGLQIYRILEAAQANGVAMLDAKTGSIFWGKTIAGEAGRGYCAHIDPRYNGVCNFEYSFDNKKFTSYGETTQLTWAFYRGTRFGIYNYNNSQEVGFVDADWFRYSNAE